MTEQPALYLVPKDPCDTALYEVSYQVIYRVMGKDIRSIRIQVEGPTVGLPSISPMFTKEVEEEVKSQ